jgi:hypothetical protein
MQRHRCGAGDQARARNDRHPTMKPVALVERALRNSSKSRDIVLDLFGGIRLHADRVREDRTPGAATAAGPQPWTVTGGATKRSSPDARSQRTGSNRQEVGGKLLVTTERPRLRALHELCKLLLGQADQGGVVAALKIDLRFGHEAVIDDCR